MEDFLISESTLKSLELMEKELGKLEKDLSYKRKDKTGTFGMKLDFKIQNLTNETTPVDQFTNQTCDERSNLNKHVLKRNESKHIICNKKESINQEIIVENVNEKAKYIDEVSNLKRLKFDNYFSQIEQKIETVSFQDDANCDSREPKKANLARKRKASGSETTDTLKSILKPRKSSNYSQTCIPEDYKEIMLVNFDSKCIIEFNEPPNILDDPLSDPGISVIDTFGNYINEDYGRSFQRSETADCIGPKYVYGISSGDLGDLKSNSFNSQSNFSIFESEMSLLIENSIDKLLPANLIPVKYASIRKKNKKINLSQTEKPGEISRESNLRSDEIIRDKIQSIESQLKEIKSLVKLTSLEKSNHTSDTKSMSSMLMGKQIFALNNQCQKIDESACTSNIKSGNLTKPREKEFEEFISPSSVSCENIPKFHNQNMAVDQAIPIEICNVDCKNSILIEYMVKDGQIFEPIHCLFQACIKQQSYIFQYSYSRKNERFSDNYPDIKRKGQFPDTRKDTNKTEKDIESECLKIISDRSGEYSERLINAIDSKNKERMLEKAIKKVIMADLADFRPIWKSNEYKSTMSSTNPEMSESIEFKTKTSCSRPNRISSDENLIDTNSKRSDIKIQTNEIQSEFSQDDQYSRKDQAKSDSMIISHTSTVKDKSNTKTIKSALVKTTTRSSKLSSSRKANNLNYPGNEKKQISQKNKENSQENSNINYIVSCIIGEIRKQFREDPDDIFTEASKYSSKQVTFDNTQNQETDVRNNNQSLCFKGNSWRTAHKTCDDIKKN